MKILIIGDVVGRPGRTVLNENFDALKQEFDADFVIINGENASSGTGIIEKHAASFFDMGVDVITTGNHVWDKKETESFIDAYPKLLRPANYPSPCPGNGYVLVPYKDTEVAVINLSGRSFMKSMDCPFRRLDQILEEIPESIHVKILDFHAETTSEKLAMGYYGANRLSLVFGTHTHVQTADHRILDEYTGYITDVGMTGPLDGIIGVQKEKVLEGFLTQRPVRYDLAKGKRQINGLVAHIDETDGKTTMLHGFIKFFD